MTERIRATGTDVLLVVDVQNDFCPGGRLPVPEGDAVVRPINSLMERFQHVVLTQDWHPPGHFSFASAHPGKQPFHKIKAAYGEQTLWPDHCVRGTQGAEFHKELETPRAELILRKGHHPDIDSYSAFFENDRATPTGLGGYLRQRGLTRIFLAGLALDYCVRYSAEDAIRSGFRAIVVDDACRALDTEGALGEARRSFAALNIPSVMSHAIGR